MGRGDRRKVRWAHGREKKAKERKKRKAIEHGQTRRKK